MSLTPQFIERRADPTPAVAPVAPPPPTPAAYTVYVTAGHGIPRRLGVDATCLVSARARAGVAARSIYSRGPLIISVRLS